MGKPAARVGDMHTCPLVNPGPTPHVGGPVLPPGDVTVLIGGMPAARIGDMATCVGPPDSIAMGSFTVLIGGKPAARLGDTTAHGGAIAVGFPTVLIGGSAQAVTLRAAAADGVPFCEECAAAADKAKKAVSKPSKEESKGKPTPLQADRAVLDRFGKSIPETAKTPRAASVTTLQSDADFRAGFLARHPGYDEKRLNSIYGESYKKSIFVNKDKNYGGTLYHESLHHYSHPDFRREFGLCKGTKVNEGVTEYFTRQLTTKGRSGHYDTERKVAKKIAKKVSEDTLRKAYFQGNKKAIQRIKDVLK